MPDWEVWDRQRLGITRLVAEMKVEVIGWATLYSIPDWVTVSPITGKPDYIRVVETALYVASKARGKRIDFALLSPFVREAEKYKFWTIQAHTFKANQPSIVLHQKCGF